MKTKSPLGLLLLPALLLLPGLHAADERTDQPAAMRQIQSARATELMGRQVSDRSGTGFATLEDFLIDIENGRVVQAVISGSDAGEGRVEVPARGFNYTRKNRALSWDCDRARLGAAPRFNPPGSNRPGQANHAAEVYRHYGEEPYFAVTDQPVRKPQNTQNNVHTHGQTKSTATPVSLGRVMLASELIGTEINNVENKKVGTIDDLILDLPSGRVVAVIINSGGFLGLGASQNAVPPGALDFVADDSNRLKITALGDALRKSPRYKKTEATRFDEPGYTDEVYRSFEQESYTAVVAADNTRANRRDRDGATLTPTDQSNATVDVETTARIRKAIIANDALSVNAQNVKIITRDKLITLRGPVNTAAEKAIIGEIAAREAGAFLRVDNRIEVAAE